MHRLLLVLFVCLLPLVACAQESRRVTLELAGTFAVPANPEGFSHNWDAGFGVSGGINYPLLPTARLSILMDVNRFSRHDVEGGDATLIYGMVNISKSFGDRKLLRIAPYVFGGTGVYYQSLSDITTTGHEHTDPVLSDGETNLGLSVGFGLEMPAGPRANLFVDGRYVVGMTKGDATEVVPIRFGIRTR